jgi:superfamily II DNA helicase RecQ
MEFRPAFRAIGRVHRQFPRRVVMVAVTATLQRGAVQKRIFDFLSLTSQPYALIRRSNLRRNINFDFRQLSEGLGGTSFPDLQWIRAQDWSTKTIVYCSTIDLALRVFYYLWWIFPGTADEKYEAVCIYTAANSKEYSSRTRKLMETVLGGQVVITTDVLAVGWSPGGIRYVVILGEEGLTLDALLQKIGRLAQDSNLVHAGLALMYYTKTAMAKAAAAVDDSAGALATKSNTKSKRVGMDPALAHFLLAPSKRVAQNEPYGNVPLSARRFVGTWVLLDRPYHSVSLFDICFSFHILRLHT